MNKIHTKQCSYCKKDFLPNPKSRVEQKFCCKNCANKDYAKRRWKKIFHPKILASIEEKKCPVCGKMFKPHIKNHTKQIYCSSYCLGRAMRRKQDAEYKNLRDNLDKNPVRLMMMKEQKQVYRNNRSSLARYFHEELLLKRKEVGWITVGEWREIKKKYRNRCALCGKKETIEEILTIDHIKKISKKGRNVKENIRPLCGKCNVNESKMDSIHTPIISN